LNNIQSSWIVGELSNRLKEFVLGLKSCCFAVPMNREKFETELFLLEQLELGFKPKWFITYHLFNPVENKIKSNQSIWNSIPHYEYYDNRRNDYEAIVEDTSQIKNIALKYLYDIKRLDQDWKYDFPNLMFFHEKGKVKRQYHTHLLMPKCKYENKQLLEFIWNNKLKKKRKCFSKYHIHIREIDNPILALSYVNKETSMKHNSLDYINSHFIQPRK